MTMPKGAISSVDEMRLILDKAKEKPITLFVSNPRGPILKLEVDEKSEFSQHLAIISNVKGSEVQALSVDVFRSSVYSWRIFPNYWDAHAHNLRSKK